MGFADPSFLGFLELAESGLFFMSNGVGKDNRLPVCFDRELFDSSDRCLGKNQCCASDIIFFSDGAEEGLFSGIEHSVRDQAPATSEKDPIRMESPPMESTTPTPGNCDTKFSNGKFTLSPGEEKPTVHTTARRKRKRSSIDPSLGETDEFKAQLYSMLESTNRVLTAHVESQNINRQLDRNQRKQHADNLVGVLGKLADALGKIADRL